MKILHLISDSLFTDFIIDLFEEVYKDGSIYLISTPHRNSQLVYTSKRESSRVIIAGKDTDAYNSYIKNSTADVIIIHCLHNYKASIIADTPKRDHQIYVWLAWGTDLAWIPGFYPDLFYNETRKALSKTKISNLLKFKALGRSIYYGLKKASILKTYKKAVQRMDFCATVIPTEYDAIKTLLGKDFNAKKISFSYATLENSLGPDLSQSSFELGDSILVGNSASPTSNHLDVFFKLKDLDLKERKVLAPLNYGDYNTYVEEVLSVGRRLFSEKFVPLTGKVLPKADYIEILKDCGIAIMAHERQQAVGNLIILLWFGARIFLSENSPTYDYFRGIGLNVFSYQSDLSQSILKKLTTHEVQTNRNVILQLYGEKHVKSRLNTTLNTFSRAINQNKK